MAGFTETGALAPVTLDIQDGESVAVTIVGFNVTYTFAHLNGVLHVRHGMLKTSGTLAAATTFPSCGKG